MAAVFKGYDWLTFKNKFKGSDWRERLFVSGPLRYTLTYLTIFLSWAF